MQQDHNMAISNATSHYSNYHDTSQSGIIAHTSGSSFLLLNDLNLLDFVLQTQPPYRHARMDTTNIRARDILSVVQLERQSAKFIALSCTGPVLSGVHTSSSGQLRRCPEVGCCTEPRLNLSNNCNIITPALLHTVHRNRNKLKRKYDRIRP